MFVILWEFHPAPDRDADFQAAYGADGPWAKLFRRHPGFVGTELLHDADNARRYLTLDRWESAEAYEKFRATGWADYEALDTECARLTVHEARIGSFNI